MEGNVCEGRGAVFSVTSPTLFYFFIVTQRSNFQVFLVILPPSTKVPTCSVVISEEVSSSPPPPEWLFLAQGTFSPKYRNTQRRGNSISRNSCYHSPRALWGSLVCVYSFWGTESSHLTRSGGVWSMSTHSWDGTRASARR